MKYKYVWISIATALVLNCNADEIDLKAMESAEKAFQESQRTELVALMSLKTMFPDSQVRALAKAAGKGRLKTMEKLVTEGVDVNSRGKQGATPLYWAFRNIDGFTKLLETGADPNLVFADSSVMHWASMHKDTRFLKTALSHGGNPNLVAGPFDETPIFDAIRSSRRNNYDAMQILLDAGANINATKGGIIFGRPFGGETAAMLAATIARFDIVYELLIQGYDYRLKDDSGQGLVDRALLFKGRFVPGSEGAEDYNKVIAWLTEREVEF